MSSCKYNKRYKECYIYKKSHCKVVRGDYKELHHNYKYWLREKFYFSNSECNDWKIPQRNKLHLYYTISLLNSLSYAQIKKMNLKTRLVIATLVLKPQFNYILKFFSPLF